TYAIFGRFPVDSSQIWRQQFASLSPFLIDISFTAPECTKGVDTLAIIRLKLTLPFYAAPMFVVWYAIFWLLKRQSILLKYSRESSPYIADSCKALDSHLKQTVLGGLMYFLSLI